ncbi:MAG: precorrin-6y C5,15-methyltransferase (decarboxylating) subunit CbiE [Alphaproteobacteria bacterium]
MTETTNRIAIIGIGEDGLSGLTASARALVDTAEVLVGGARHLAMIDDTHTAERLTWRSPLKDTVADIAARRDKRLVVLATGDPMSYGIGVTLGREFGRDAVTVLPAVGAFSLAAARLGWPLEDVDRITLHGRPMAMLAAFVRPGARLLVLSEDGTTPAQVAAHLSTAGYGGSEIRVMEHLGGDDEAILSGTAAEWSIGTCRDLNTIAVECIAGPDARVFSRAAGLPDDAFDHDGQMTKREVRAATLAVLAPQPNALLWDVGAGAGSVAIEWMRLGGKAIGIERSADRIAKAAANASALGVPTLRLIHGDAPDALDGLSAPDAVFIGGGITSPGMGKLCWNMLKPGGRLVCNAVTAEGEMALTQLHTEIGGAMTRIAVSRLEPVGPYHGWRPLMPVTQFHAVKGYE